MWLLTGLPICIFRWWELGLGNHVIWHTILQLYCTEICVIRCLQNSWFKRKVMVLFGLERPVQTKLTRKTTSRILINPLYRPRRDLPWISYFSFLMSTTSDWHLVQVLLRIELVEPPACNVRFGWSANPDGMITTCASNYAGPFIFRKVGHVVDEALRLYKLSILAYVPLPKWTQACDVPLGGCLKVQSKHCKSTDSNLDCVSSYICDSSIERHNKVADTARHHQRKLAQQHAILNVFIVISALWI